MLFGIPTNGGTMDSLTDVLAEIMGLSDEEVAFGFRLTATIDDAPWGTVHETGDYLMTLRPAHIDESTWRLAVAGVMFDAQAHDISSVATTLGMTFVQDDDHGFKVAHFPVDEVPATLV
jgi:hypothetical protein